MDNSQVILSVDSLTKTFQKDGKELFALNNLSFNLNKGEILGVIGRNGAGKSTLLKVLSQITSPTSGEISYDGQLTSIIDIGTGFHADLSGEENVYLSALLLGYTKKQIKEVYDEIVSFSGLEDFMQMPVKHYSSGMYLRLAFSIAFHSKISILLLDEVIAVGDTDFKRKCYAKIKELKLRGTAIILVSHHLEVILAQCDRCILLDDGKLMAEGSPLDVVNQYYNVIDNNEGAKIRSEIQQIPATDEFSLLTTFPLQIEHIRIDHMEFVNQPKTEKLTTACELTFRFLCSKQIDEGSFELGVFLVNVNGVRVLLDSYGLRNTYEPNPLPNGDYTISVSIPADLLSAGVYRLGIIVSVNLELLIEFESVAKFRILPERELDEARGMGSIVRPKLKWDIKSVD